MFIVITPYPIFTPIVYDIYFLIMLKLSTKIFALVLV